MPIKLGDMVPVSASGDTLIADSLTPGQRYAIVLNGAFGGNTGAISSYDGFGWTPEPDAAGITSAWRKEFLSTGTMLRINFPTNGGLAVRAFVHHVRNGR